MQDEYGHMDASGETFVCSGDFALELNGAVLKRPQVRYNTWGELNAAGDNCVVVCHALTGNASLDTWWGGLLGPGRAFDTQRYFVVCANVLGSCYGTTGPTSPYPEGDVTSSSSGGGSGSGSSGGGGVAGVDGAAVAGTVAKYLDEKGFGFVRVGPRKATSCEQRL